jgi:hypothetical protein
MVEQIHVKHKIKPAIIYSLLSFLILLGWAVGSPPGSSPDEDLHLTSSWCYSKYQGATCETVPLRLVEVGKCYFKDSGIIATCEKSIPKDEVSPERIYSDKSYYHFLANFVSLDSIDKSTVQMRIANSFFSSISILVIVLLTSRLIYLPIIISWLVVNIPLGFFLISSVNPSSWLYIFSFLFLPLTYRIFAEKNQAYLFTTKLLILGLTFLLSLNARPDTLLFASIFGITLLPVIFISEVKKLITRIAIYLSTLFISIYLMLSIWSRSNLVNFRESKISSWEIVTSLPSIITGVFGGWGLGSLETTMPPVTYVGSFVIVLALLFYGLRFVNLPEAVSIFLIGLFVFIVPFFVLLRSNLRVGEWLQPRYILPIFYVLIGLSLIIIFRSFHEKSLLIIVNLIFFLSSITFTFSLHTFYRRYVAGLDNFNLFFEKTNSWWWEFSIFPNPFTFFTFTVIVYLVFWITLKREILTNLKTLSPKDF